METGDEVYAVAVPTGLDLTRLGAAPGVVLDVADLGATAHRLEVAGRDGVRRNVLLGYRTAQEYLDGTDYLGGVIGRYANRIAGGAFDLDGRRIQVGVHDRGHHLHGGPDGFDRRRWSLLEATHARATYELVSPDGDQGFPGTLTARASYLVDGDQVRIELEATTDAPTVVNLTSHAYFNLDGDGAGSIDRHRLTVAADTYTPVDDTGIPIGRGVSVSGTPFDFRDGRDLGEAVRSEHHQLAAARGVDHNLELEGDGFGPVAWLESERSGIRLAVATDQPGLQVYTGNFLDGSTRSASGAAYRQGDGIALEPQLFPDTPNRPDFGSAVLLPGDTYRSTIQWRFSLPG